LTFSSPITWRTPAIGASAAGGVAEVDCAANTGAVAITRKAKTLVRGLFDRNFGALLVVFREVLDARVQHAPHALQHFDTGVAKMLASVLRPNVIQEGLNLRRGDVAKETAVGMLRPAVLRGAVLLVHDQPSFISTVNILF